jgi:predicted transcriptional regulator
MSTLNIRIDDALAAELERLARSRHQTKSELARDMLRRRLAVERFRELRKRAMPFAEAAGYVEDEDVFGQMP